MFPPSASVRYRNRDAKYPFRRDSEFVSLQSPLNEQRVEALMSEAS